MILFPLIWSEYNLQNIALQKQGILEQIRLFSPIPSKFYLVLSLQSLHFYDEKGQNYFSINFRENVFESSLFLPDSAVLATFSNTFHPGQIYSNPPLIKFRDFFHPPRLFQSPRLLGTRE